MMDEVGKGSISLLIMNKKIMRVHIHILDIHISLLLVYILIIFITHVASRRIFLVLFFIFYYCFIHRSASHRVPTGP